MESKSTQIFRVKFNHLADMLLTNSKPTFDGPESHRVLNGRSYCLLAVLHHFYITLLCPDINCFTKVAWFADSYQTGEDNDKEQSRATE